MSKKILKLSRYQLGVIALYLVFMTGIFLLLPEILRYDFRSLPSIYLLVSFLFLTIGISWYRRGTDIRTTTLVVLYAFAFAIPEEILFRGFMQGVVLQSIGSGPVLIAASSFVFGLAHLPNGARGWRPIELNWNLCGLTLLAGLPLGYFFLATGNLLLPTLFHTLLLVWHKLFMEQSKTPETSRLV